MLGQENFQMATQLFHSLERAAGEVFDEFVPAVVKFTMEHAATLPEDEIVAQVKALLTTYAGLTKAGVPAVKATKMPLAIPAALGGLVNVPNATAPSGGRKRGAAAAATAGTGPQYLSKDAYMAYLASGGEPICAYTASRGAQAHKVCGAPALNAATAAKPDDYRCGPCTKHTTNALQKLLAGSTTPSTVRAPTVGLTVPNAPQPIRAFASGLPTGVPQPPRAPGLPPSGMPTGLSLRPSLPAGRAAAPPGLGIPGASVPPRIPGLVTSTSIPGLPAGLSAGAGPAIGLPPRLPAQIAQAIPPLSAVASIPEAVVGDAPPTPTGAAPEEDEPKLKAFVNPSLDGIAWPADEAYRKLAIIQSGDDDICIGVVPFNVTPSSTIPRDWADQLGEIDAEQRAWLRSLGFKYNFKNAGEPIDL